MKKFLIIGLAVLAIGGVVSLALTKPEESVSNTGSNQTSVQTNQPAPNQNAQLAPNFTLKKLGGGEVSLAEFKGNKPVVLDFWATWCHNCQRDMPKMNTMYEKYKDRVEIIAINLQEGESEIKRFVDQRGLDFIIALDPSSTAASAYGIRYTNSHFLIDKSGKIIKMIPGDITEADFESLVEA